MDISFLLEHRRDVADVMFLIKTIKNEINCADIQSQITYRTNLKNTRNKNIFTTMTSKTNIAQNSPLNRCMTLCNILANPPYNINVLHETPTSLKIKLQDLVSIRETDA